MLFVSFSSLAAELYQYCRLGSIRAAGIHARLCGGFCGPTQLYSRGLRERAFLSNKFCPEGGPQQSWAAADCGPSFHLIFHTPLHEQVMVLAGDRVWEGSKEEKMFNLVLEACLGFNSQRREKRHSRQRKRQGAACRRSPPWQG